MVGRLGCSMRTQITGSLEKAANSRTKEVIKLLDAIQDTQINIGFFAGTQYPDGTPVAAVAKWNNDGTARIPERPFFTKGMLVGRMAARAVFEEMFPEYMSGDIPLKALQAAIGETYQNSVVSAIDSDMPPPNAPSTWERKMMKGLKKSGQKKFKALKGEDYQKALEAMDEKYTSGKSEGKYKYRTGSGGSPKTLIDTGIMRKSVRWKVV